MTGHRGRESLIVATTMAELTEGAETMTNRMTATELAQHRVSVDADALSNAFARRIDEGYDMLDAAEPTSLVPIPSWGRDGWDLGDWPCWAYLIPRVVPTEDWMGWLLVEYITGTARAWVFPTREERNRAIDLFAHTFWSQTGTVEADPDDERYCGPFSWSRLDREPTTV